MSDPSPAFGPVAYTVRGVGTFQTPEYDVVFAEVESDDLVRLNKTLAQMPHTDTHPTYHPHITIGYVKSGLGAKYKELFAAKLAGRTLTGTATSLTFCTPDRQHVSIPLGADVMTRAGLVADLLTDVICGLGGKPVHTATSVRSFLATHRKALDAHHHYHDDHTGQFAHLATAAKPIGHPSHIALAGRSAVHAARRFARGVHAITTALAAKCVEFGIEPRDILDDAEDFARITYHAGNWLTQHTGVGVYSAAVVGSHLLAYAWAKLRGVLGSRVVGPKGEIRKSADGMGEMVGSAGSFLCDAATGPMLDRRTRRKKRRAVRKYAKRVLKALQAGASPEALVAGAASGDDDQGDPPADSSSSPGDHGAPELLLALLHAHASGDEATVHKLESLAEDPAELARVLAMLEHGSVQKAFDAGEKRDDHGRWSGNGSNHGGDVEEKKEPHEMTRAEWSGGFDGPGGRDEFVRFGGMPPGGKSVNNIDDTEEDGVSAFRLMEDAKGPYFITGESGTSGPGGLHSWMEGRDVFLVKANEIGTGADGEPLFDADSAKAAARLKVWKDGRKWRFEEQTYEGD